MIPTRKKYYILRNKLQLIVHLRLNLSNLLFLILTHFSISNLFLILCFIAWRRPAQVKKLTLPTFLEIILYEFMLFKSNSRSFMQIIADSKNVS